MRIGGFHRLGETQVAQGVFVGAVHLGVRWQGRQAGEGGLHLFGGTLEHAPATGGEQGVATEQYRRCRLLAEQGDMPQRVARHRQYLESHAQHGHLVAFVQRQVTAGNALVGRAADPCAGQLLELFHAADMVVVVVGDQDIAQHPLGVGGQPALHRAGITRIDHRAAAFGSIL
ncbi:hypothetical protein D3C77_485030 [compost metagenome]